MKLAPLFLFFAVFAASDLSAATGGDCALEKINAIEKSVPPPGRTAKRALSLEGIACADECLSTNPNDGACHYYRGVNRGHLLESMLANPKTHIPLMVEDFKKAASLDPRIDGAGPPRALAYIYLQLPSISLWGGEYKRSLDKAASYADKALKLAPNEPDNLKLAGEIAAERKDFKTALLYFEKSLDGFKKNPGAARGNVVTETEKLLREMRGKT